VCKKAGENVRGKTSRRKCPGEMSISLDRYCVLHLRLLESAFGMSKSTASVGWHPNPLNLQLTAMFCSLKMSVAVDAGPKSAEIDQLSCMRLM